MPLTRCVPTGLRCHQISFTAVGINGDDLIEGAHTFIKGSFYSIFIVPEIK